MFQISTLNNISVKGLERFSREEFEVASERKNPDGLLVRSAKISPEQLVPTLKAIARAGAGVDKICVSDCTLRGIPVFNTPGANANSVKELVMLALLLSTRGVIRGVNFVRELAKEISSPEELTKQVEAGKKQFAGSEIKGKTLGVVGLGAIGSLVADMGLSMGMEVIGYDPALSVESAWRLSNQVQKADNLPSLLSKADFVTLHLPMLATTRYMINEDSLKFFKKGAKLLNFSRDAVVDAKAVENALNDKTLGRFVADFPYHNLVNHENVILLPHIGASTKEAEENCAVMAADQLIDFLKNGNITNSVNFPTLHLERSSGFRLAFSNENVPNMLGQVLAILAAASINVADMLNKSRANIAYTLIDVDQEIPSEILEKIKAIQGVYAVRCL